MSDINEMNVGQRWYVAHTYSGYENKVKTSLEKIIENRGLDDLIFDIKIPVQIIIEKKGDQEIEVEEKLFPGYVYIKMIMNDESWHAVRGITGVTGFVGPGSRPVPLTDKEIKAFNVEVHSDSVKFKVGDKVSVISGIFQGYSGVIKEISEDMKQVTVLASTERRDIPIIVEAKDISVSE